MITHKRGNLVTAFLNGETEAIAHQANCFNTMASGVAKEIKEKIPQAYEADCQTNKGDPDKLGTLSATVVENAEGFAWVFNLYGQYNYGREPGMVYTDLEALRSAMGQMKLFLDAANLKRVGLPKLGCGLGGARWEDVEEIINDVLSDFDVTVYTL